MISRISVFFFLFLILEYKTVFHLGSLSEKGIKRLGQVYGLRFWSLKEGRITHPRFASQQGVRSERKENLKSPLFLHCTLGKFSVAFSLEMRVHSHVENE